MPGNLNSCLNYFITAVSLKKSKLWVYAFTSLPKYFFSFFSWAITDKYPTVRSLLMAFGANGSDEAKEKLLAGIPYDNGTKKIPAAVSKIISYLFNDDELNWEK